MAIKDLNERRQEVAAEIRRLADLANNDDHTWSAEDENAWTQANTDFDDLEAKLARQQRAADVDAALDRSVDLDSRPGRQDTEPTSRDISAQPVTDEQRGLAFGAWLRSANDLKPTERQLEACELLGVDPRKRHYDIKLSRCSGPPMWATPGGYTHETRVTDRDVEMRAPQTVTTTGGGHAIPESFVRDIDYAMLQFGGPRQVSRIIRTTGGGPLDIPTVDDTSNKGELLAINTEAAEQAVTFGQVTLDAYKYSSKEILVPEELIEDEEAGFVSDIPMLLGERLGRITAEHYTDGTGSSQPNGVVTASTAGVTAASATVIDPDEIFDLFHACDPAYRALPSAGWMLHDQTLLAIRKMVDGDSQYLWQPGLQSSEPSQILGKPYTVNQDMDQIATTNKVLLFGAFEKFAIRDVRTIRLYRLNERYRDLDQTGFIAFIRTDSDILQAAAVQHLVMA